MNDDAFDLVVNALSSRGALLIDYAHSVLRRPMLGGQFGHGGYSIASLRSESNGLYCVYYAVVHEDSGTPLSFERTIPGSLSEARFLLGQLTDGQRMKIYHGVKDALLAHVAAARDMQEAVRRAHRESLQISHEPKKVPKRRRQVFEKSNGTCHYCGAALSLDGRWHIEHKMPRALLGGSEMYNLVASCVSCNLRKKDSTDLEFIAAMAVRVAA